MDPSGVSSSMFSLDTEKNRIELCSTILRELLGLYENIGQRQKLAATEEEEKILLKKEMESYQRAIRNINIVVEELESVELAMIKTSKKNSQGGKCDLEQELESIQSRTNYRSILEKAKSFEGKMEEIIRRNEMNIDNDADCFCATPGTSMETERNSAVQKKIKELSDLCDLMSTRRIARMEAEKALAASSRLNASKLNKENVPVSSRNPKKVVPPVSSLPQMTQLSSLPPALSALVVQQFSADMRAAAEMGIPYGEPIVNLDTHDPTQDPNAICISLSDVLPFLSAGLNPGIAPSSLNTGSPMNAQLHSTEEAHYNSILRSFMQLPPVDPTCLNENTRCRSKVQVPPNTMRTITNLPNSTPVVKVTSTKIVSANTDSKASKNNSSSSNPFGKFRNNKLPVRPYSENENQKKGPERPKDDPSKKLPSKDDKPPSSEPMVPVRLPNCNYEPEDYIPIDGRYKIVPHLERKRSGTYGMLPLPYIQFLPWVPVAPPTYFDDTSPFRPRDGRVAKSYSQVFHRPPL